MCISTNTSDSSSNSSNCISSSDSSSSSPDLLHRALLLDDCKPIQPILPDNDDGDRHYAHLAKATMSRKRPRLADCMNAEHWGRKRSLAGSATSSESSTPAMPEPDSTLMDSDEEEQEKGERKNSHLKSMEAVEKKTKPSPSAGSSIQADQLQNRSKMRFSLLMDMWRFEPGQITVTVHPARRTLEVRGAQETQCSPAPMVSPFSDDDAAPAVADKTSSKSPAECSASVDFERLEFVKHLKVPANVALEALSCTLDQNGWLKVEAPTREDTTATNSSSSTTTTTTPDQSTQWTEARLIPVKVIDRGLC